MTDSVNKQDAEGIRNLDADSMQKSDVTALIKEFRRVSEETNTALSKVVLGSGYETAEEKLKGLINEVSNGGPVAFAGRNSWMSKKDLVGEFLHPTAPKADDTPLKTLETHEFVYEFYRVVHNTAEFRTKFIKLINFCFADNIILTAYRMRLFKDTMTETVKQEDIALINSVFRSFDRLYVSFNSSTVFDKIDREVYCKADAVANMSDYIGDMVRFDSSLGELLDGLEKVVPSLQNKWYIYDRYTVNFNGYAENEV